MIRLLDQQECEQIASDLLDIMEAKILAVCPDATETEKARNLQMIAAGLLSACNMVAESLE